MAEVSGTVTTSFATRSINSDVSSGQDAARTAATGTIDAVDTILSQFETEGTQAFDLALTALELLGEFKPGDVKFQYTIPEYLLTEFELPTEFTYTSPASAVLAIPETGQLVPTLLNVDVPPNTASAPEVPAFVLPPAPALSSGSGLAPAPPMASIVIPSAPELTEAREIAISTPALPSLKDFSSASYVAFDLLPIFTPYPLDDLPAIPEIREDQAARLSDDIKLYERRHDFVNTPEFLISWSERFRDLYVKDVHHLYPRLTAAPQASAQLTWLRRGHVLPDEFISANSEYRRVTKHLARRNAEMQRSLGYIDAQRAKAEAETSVVLKQWRSDFEVNMLGILKSKYAAAQIYIEAWYELYRSAVSLYNARVRSFATEVTQYKTQLASLLGVLQNWKIAVDAEIAKASLNDKAAQLYAARAESEALKVQLYNAQLEQLAASVEEYKTRIEAFAAQSDVARSQLGVFKGSVDAYIASLAGYRAQFDVYEAQARSVAAQNQLEESKLTTQAATMQAAGADSLQASLAIETEAEKLKLEARLQSAVFDNQKLVNAVETIKAQIAADEGRQQIAAWSANQQIGNVENDAISTEARAAAQYYSNASDSAYRASEQAFRAILASAQASTIAQESAGRTAASLAQGAYSAISVGASMTGSGSISADESQDARRASQINDYLNYSEDYQQILSA